MKWRSTLGLALVLAVLAGGYFYSLWSEKAEVRRVEEAKRFFPEQTPGDVVRIVFERPDAQTIEGERGPDGWAIVKPHPLPAANPAWERVANALAELKNQRTIEETPDNPADYNLDAPKLTVRFETAGGEEHRFSFGATEPTQRYRFTEDDSGAVVLIADNSFQELNRQLDELRNRFVLGDGSDEIMSLAFTRFKESDTWDEALPEELRGAEEQTTVKFDRGDDGRWKMTLPFEAKASQEDVQALWQIVQNATGEDYVDTPESLDDYGLAPAGARLTVGFKSGKPEQTLYLGSIRGSGDSRRMFVKRDEHPSVFTVHIAVKDALPSTPTEFREHRLLTRNIGNLTRYEYKEGSVSMALGEGETGGWQILDPEGLKLDQEAFSIYLAFLNGARGDEFPETEPEAFAEAATISLYFTDKDDSQQVSTIVLGGPGPGGDSWFAKQDTGETMLVSTLTRDALRATLFKFEEKRLAPLFTTRVGRVELRFEDNDFSFEKREERWVVTAPENKVWERQADMDLLLDALCDAKAQTLAPAPAEGPAVPNPILEAALFGLPAADSSGEALARYTVGDVSPSDGQLRYAAAAGRDRVVFIEQRTIDRVREALRGVVDRD